MQMGARWQFGDDPHRSVPQQLHDSIREQEDRFPDADSWTLTWLEGRPHLGLDDSVVVMLDARGSVVVRDLDGARSVEPEVSGPQTGTVGVAPSDDDDDAWLI